MGNLHCLEPLYLVNWAGKQVFRQTQHSPRGVPKTKELGVLATNCKAKGYPQVIIPDDVC